MTAIPGGLFMVLGAWLGPESLGLPAEVYLPPALLEGTPFSSYLVPGLLLAVIVGGTQLWAFLLTIRRMRWAEFLAAVAGFALLIWIFVQMVFVPFSFLQALYFTAGLAEFGFLMVLLGLVPTPGHSGVESGQSASTPHGRSAGGNPKEA
ncbi:hypothetical protein [Arthrobacter silvisoli]|uniref:hypothetical protein n=1 Tax=Arthrobacter silvisoli TaxID=2291022 RepID=UPI001B34D0AF|nr:hypothetical protein [Arthrobacter silvisoli]